MLKITNLLSELRFLKHLSTTVVSDSFLNCLIFNRKAHLYCLIARVVSNVTQTMNQRPKLTMATENSNLALDFNHSKPVTILSLFSQL